MLIICFFILTLSPVSKKIVAPIRPRFGVKSFDDFGRLTEIFGLGEKVFGSITYGDEGFIKKVS